MVTHSELSDLVTRFTDAFNRDDLDAVMGFFADDAIVLPNNAPRADGRAAVRAVMAQFLRTPGLAMTLSGSVVTVSAAGDLAIDVGAYQTDMTGPEGRPVRDVGKYVTIYRRVGEEWKIALTVSNSDLPPPR